MKHKLNHNLGKTPYLNVESMYLIYNISNNFQSHKLHLQPTLLN